jgi:hypothetical protein
MKKRGAGWIPDYPDQSDYTLENVALSTLLCYPK